QLDWAAAVDSVQRECAPTQPERGIGFPPARGDSSTRSALALRAAGPPMAATIRSESESPRSATAASRGPGARDAPARRLPRGTPAAPPCVLPAAATPRPGPGRLPI